MGTVLLAGLMSACGGGETPDYDLAAVPERGLRPEVEARGVRVGGVTAELDGAAAEWPVLIQAGYRPGSGWRRGEDGGGVARFRGDSRADSRFELDIALDGDGGGGLSLASPVRLRSSAPLDGKRTLMTFVPAAENGVVLDRLEVDEDGELLVEGRFRGTLNHASIEPIVVENGAFSALLPADR